ncbi:hypothetical protein HGRIS_011933 [Hohenbuehelia grisea]|uniref:HNH nuclease domain-containing protein n=1 Tax=Hohenbuehelia grisea TaxID=104357 RepID=A0ABR3JXK5_9AGAR
MVVLILPSLSDPPAVCLRLTIPLHTIQSLCLHPAKWLRFVGWTIFLTREGYLSKDADGNDRLTDDAVLNDADSIFYNAPGLVISSAIDTDIVARRTSSQTSANDSRVGTFSSNIDTRDDGCIFTNHHGDACHIIPFARGSDWIQLISTYRFIEPAIEDINDTQNGFACFNPVHGLLDKRQLAILVTPNDILECGDVPVIDPPPTQRDDRPSPSGLRYTLQHLRVDSKDLRCLQDNNALNNRDARFRKPSEALPHPGLLHYVYGASIVKAFGESTSKWNLSDKRVRPSPKQGYPSQRPYTPRGPRKSTQEHRRQNQRPSPYPSASKSTGERAGGRRLTEDDAMNYMFKIASNQVARRQRTAWEQRRRDIEGWISVCGHGVDGSLEQDGTKT